MPLSFKILKGLAEISDLRVLELRRSFMHEDTEPVVTEAVIPQADHVQMAVQMLKEAEETAEIMISDARSEAREIEQKARRRAEELAGQEAEKIEKIKLESRAEGFEQGRKEALAKAAADASSIREQARSVLRQAEEIRRQTLESIESDVVRLAIDIAEKLVSTKLSMDPRVVVEIAKQAIGMLHDRDQVVLFVNPIETSLYEERREELIKQLSPKGELHIVPDPEIKPGGCVAETEYGRVDAKLDTRWEGLLKALEEINQ